MEERNDIVIYKSEDGLVKMEAMVDPAGETIWATQKAIAALFGKDVSDISRHIRNVYTRGELSEESTLQKMQIAFSDKPVQYYNLDMIISVGYRVNSVRATRFRIWATDIIKQYMLKGYAVNRKAHVLPLRRRFSERRPQLRQMRCRGTLRGGEVLILPEPR